MASGTRRSEMNCDVERTPNTTPRGSPRIELDDEARDPVEQHVEPERPARERTSPAFGEEEQYQDDELRTALVQLRGMQRHAERRADVRGRLGIGEGHRPRHAGRPSVAAARAKHPRRPMVVAERDAWGEHVARLPERQCLAPDVAERHRHGEDQAAIEDAARSRRVTAARPGCSCSDRSRRRTAAAWRRRAR